MRKTVMAAVISAMLFMAQPASAQSHIDPPPCVMELPACEVVREAQGNAARTVSDSVSTLSEALSQPDSQPQPKDDQRQPQGNQGNRGNPPQDPQDDAPREPPQNPPDDAPRGPRSEPDVVEQPPTSGQGVNDAPSGPSSGQQPLPNVVTPVEPDEPRDAPIDAPTEEPTEESLPLPILPRGDRVFTQGELLPLPPGVQNAISDNIAIVLALVVFGIWVGFIYPVKRRVDSIAGEIQSVRQILENPKV